MGERRKPPNERNSITHKFYIGVGDPEGLVKGYVTVGLYEDGTPCEMFIQMDRTGSTYRGLMDTIAILVSLALQSGVPLKTIIDKLARTHFEPYGRTSNPAIPRANSIVDYLARWLAMKFIKDDENKAA